MVKFVPDGNCKVLPPKALQVPAVNVLPATWAIGVRAQEQRAGIRFDGARVVQSSIDVKLRRAVTAGFADSAGVEEGGLAAQIVDSRIRLDQVRRPRLDFQGRWRDVVTVKVQVASSGLDDRPVIVEGAIVIETFVDVASEVERSQVGHVSQGGIEVPASPLEHTAGKVERDTPESRGKRSLR